MSPATNRESPTPLITTDEQHDGNPRGQTALRTRITMTRVVNNGPNAALSETITVIYEEHLILNDQTL